MSADLYISANGLPVTSCRVTVGSKGPWTAELHLPVDDALTSPVTIRMGALTLVGTVDPRSQNTYATQRKVRVTAGAGAWSKVLGPSSYHNDASLKARLIVEDLCRQTGETLGDFVPQRERIGLDYMRESAPASRTLEAVIGEAVTWWVGYDGRTMVGTRPTLRLEPEQYTVLAFDPLTRVVALTTDDPSIVQVGSLISQGLDAPGVVRELELSAGGEDKLTITAWLAGSDRDAGRLGGLLTSIARRATDSRCWGTFRYRVVSQSASDERLDLQAIDKNFGLPDLRAITPCPGVAGVHGVVPVGGQVLVTFAEGDRSRPYVVAYAPFGSEGFVPSGQLSGARAARVGDEVQSGGVGTMITIGPPVVPPAPPVPLMSGVAYPVSFGTSPVTPTPNKLVGTITKGSSLVKIGGDSV